MSAPTGSSRCVVCDDAGCEFCPAAMPSPTSIVESLYPPAAWNGRLEDRSDDE